MDEAGVMEGMGINGLVVGRKGRKAILKKAPGTRVWISFIECISATGKSTTPLVIFKGQTVQQQWFPPSLKPFQGWEFTTIQNGWTNNQVGTEWLEKVFILQTQPDDPTESRLLILDGHGSHTTDQFMWLCLKHRIHVVYLPPYCSYVLQPLDLGVFSSLKTAYRKHLANLVTWAKSTIVGKQNFLEYYRRARLIALTASNILSGWKATGLWPINIAKPLLNRLLLENTNQVPTTPPPTESIVGTRIPGLNATWEVVQPLDLGPWVTPNNVVDLRRQVVDFNLQTGASRTQRQLFQKIEKAFDERDVTMAVQGAENEALRAQLEATKQKKRRRVDTNPNELFADITAVRRAQIAAGSVEVGQEDSPEDGDSSDTGSCIVVATNSRR
jgi:4-hydroxybenzoate polyprenyltransferase